MINKPKILLLDYETSPAKGYFFGSIWETNIVKVIEYEQILSVSWKWYGEKGVHVKGQDDFKGYKKGVLNDEAIVRFFAKELEKADFVVAHNGVSFDFKVFNTRLLNYRMKPMPEFRVFDTKTLVKSRFHLPSNKLNDIADFLGIGEKLKHTGFSMWLGCEAGNKKDWATMKKYDRQDTVLLDKIFTIIFPYVKVPTMFNKIDKDSPQCSNPSCNSFHLQARGFSILSSGVRKSRYQCQDCGKWGTTEETVS
jgi:predicted PolB exonuclease-like 3'-5' exonuclease